MDYKEIPRPLIYKQRDNLRDFEVNNPSALNKQLFAHLKAIPLMRVENAKELALRCFNNAYYICTLIGLEEFPDLCVADYEKLLLGNNERYYDEDVCAASMAMVCEMLRAYDYQWGTDSMDTIEAIHYRFSHFRWLNTGARNSFFLMEQKCSWENANLSRNEFAPRDIYEAVDNISYGALVKYHKDICQLLALCPDHRKRIGGADLALARLKEAFHELEQEWEGKYEDLLKDITIEPSDLKDFDKILQAEDYIRDYYPKLQENDVVQHSPALSNVEKLPQTIGTTPDTEMMHVQTKEQQAQVKQLLTQLDEQKRQLAERDATIEELNAKIADYAARFDLKDKRTGKAIAILSGKQHVILCLAILAYLGKIPNARRNLAPQLQAIAARRESYMEGLLGEAITPKECEATATFFEPVTPYIAKLIRELPEKLKADKSEKNRSKAKKTIDN